MTTTTTTTTTIIVIITIFIKIIVIIIDIVIVVVLLLLIVIIVVNIKYSQYPSSFPWPAVWLHQVCVSGTTADIFISADEKWPPEGAHWCVSSGQIRGCCQSYLIPYHLVTCIPGEFHRIISYLTTLLPAFQVSFTEISRTLPPCYLHSRWVSQNYLIPYHLVTCIPGEFHRNISYLTTLLPAFQVSFTEISHTLPPCYLHSRWVSQNDLIPYHLVTCIPGEFLRIISYLTTLLPAFQVSFTEWSHTLPPCYLHSRWVSQNYLIPYHLVTCIPGEFHRMISYLTTLLPAFQVSFTEWSHTLPPCYLHSRWVSQNYLIPYHLVTCIPGEFHRIILYLTTLLPAFQVSFTELSHTLPPCYLHSRWVSQNYLIPYHLVTCIPGEFHRIISYLTTLLPAFQVSFTELSYTLPPCYLHSRWVSQNYLIPYHLATCIPGEFHRIISYLTTLLPAFQVSFTELSHTLPPCYLHSRWVSQNYLIPYHLATCIPGEFHRMISYLTTLLPAFQVSFTELSYTLPPCYLHSRWVSQNYLIPYHLVTCIPGEFHRIISYLTTLLPAFQVSFTELSHTLPPCYLHSRWVSQSYLIPYHLVTCIPGEFHKIISYLTTLLPAFQVSFTELSYTLPPCYLHSRWVLQNYLIPYHLVTCIPGEFHRIISYLTTLLPAFQVSFTELSHILPPCYLHSRWVSQSYLIPYHLATCIPGEFHRIILYLTTLLLAFQVSFTELSHTLPPCYLHSRWVSQNDLIPYHLVTCIPGEFHRIISYLTTLLPAFQVSFTELSHTLPPCYLHSRWVSQNYLIPYHLVTCIPGEFHRIISYLTTLLLAFQVSFTELSYTLPPCYLHSRWVSQNDLIPYHLVTCIPGEFHRNISYLTTLLPAFQVSFTYIYDKTNRPTVVVFI